MMNDRLWMIEIGHPCPKCGIAISAMQHPEIESFAVEYMQEYGIELDDDWHAGKVNPTLVFCDCPACTYVAAAEWAVIQKHLSELEGGPEADYWDELNRPQQMKHTMRHHEGRVKRR